MRTSCTFSMKIKLHRTKVVLENTHFSALNTLINIMCMFFVFNVFKLLFQLIIRMKEEEERTKKKRIQRKVHLLGIFRLIYPNCHLV